MKTTNLTFTALGTALLLLCSAACGDNGPGTLTSTVGSNTFNTFPPDSNSNDNHNEPDPTNGQSNSSVTEDATSNTPTGNGPTSDDATSNVPTTDNPTSNGPTTNNPSTDSTSTTTTNDPTATDESQTNPDPSTNGDMDFAFDDDPPSAFVQIDRHGAPEAGTAGIRGADGLGFSPGEDITIRDDYNASTPVADASSMWLPEIADSITFFHDAFDDDMQSLGLVPASFTDSVNQAGPVIIPDTIKYNPSKPAGFPNGRKLTDPVVDIILAAVLLKIGAQQPISLFADIPLNPPKNDVSFKNSFPFLAPPH